MGTRGLTMVYQGGDFRVAQYGQWDHYPSGQGMTILKFLLEGTDALAQGLKKVEWLSSGEYDRRVEKLLGEKKRWITMEEGELIDREMPFISRNIGGKILRLIAEHEGDGPIELMDQRDFVRDSLYCEGVYVVDLDARTYEVYEGFQKKPHDKGRFASTEERDGYYPVALIASWPLDKLPSDEEFLAIEKEEE